MVKKSSKIVPSIPVSEISKLLINERKRILKAMEIHLPKTVKKINVIDYIDIQFVAIRNILELRRRSREGINVPKNVRSVRKIHCKRK